MILSDLCGSPFFFGIEKATIDGVELVPISFGMILCPFSFPSQTATEQELVPKSIPIESGFVIMKLEFDRDSGNYTSLE